MSDNAIFAPYSTVLLVACVWQIGLLWVIARANRRGRLLPGALWRASAVVDLAVPASLLTISAFVSPRGPIPALSSPPLLLFPIVVRASVLRLRPLFTLYTGLAAAVIHFLLVGFDITGMNRRADPTNADYCNWAPQSDAQSLLRRFQTIRRHDSDRH